MSTVYSVSGFKLHPTMNVFYSSVARDPLPDAHWGYTINGLKGGTLGQIFNATIENSADNALTSEAKLIILLPADFTNISSTGPNTGWDEAIIVKNPDDSHVINVNTTATSFAQGNLTYQFVADVPVVEEAKLYVFQTTAVYPTWSNPGFNQLQLASALSEAGVEVVP